jgi:hypothetical protein
MNYPNRRSELWRRRNSEFGAFVYPDRPAITSVHSSTPNGTALGRGLFADRGTLLLCAEAGVSSAGFKFSSGIAQHPAASI